ncbi:hypothetical protein [Pelotomaculum sp. FP]|uniref:hypothetical protein n=1 Tax=Pelotomaculum sp. FP TaxID=261474 RepID=UPI00186478CD|nr:hypothetical protein [Pelotomaculum sp. FP]
MVLEVFHNRFNAALAWRICGPVQVYGKAHALAELLKFLGVDYIAIVFIHGK